MDANTYREAKTKLGGDIEELKARYEKAQTEHINDVRAAQRHFQNGDFVIADCELASGSKSRGGKWISKAVGMAKENMKRLSKLHRVGVSELAVVNIWVLSALGGV